MSAGTFRERAQTLLEAPGLSDTIGRAMDRRGVARRAAFDGVDLEAMRTAGEAIRAHTVADLAGSLERFVDNAEARGATVFFASTGSEAVGYVREVVRAQGAELVVKSKSMVSEEIGVNRALEADGIRVLETDLGEYIVQLAGESPAHITVPAVHKTRDQIRELFQRSHGVELSTDPSELTAFARQVLREAFLAADVGITGVNFGVVDTGSLVLVTNEGNGRMCTSLPRVHIALMGMERLVPSFRELGLMLPLLTGSATGQRMTTYVTLVNGPRGRGEPDGPEELHIVLLDNGRSSILGGPYHSVLHCIRCGACQNVCPVFRLVGGHAYGGVYGGPIGAVLEPLLSGSDAAGDLPFASSLCGACSDVCPVRIPLHEQLLGLRHDLVQRRAPVPVRETARWWGRLWRSADGYRRSSSLARLAQTPFARGGAIRRAPSPLSRWTAGRDLPAIARWTFRERWGRRRDGHGA